MGNRIAIIGTGIAGMGCAHFLQDDYDITLFEKNNYIGGHTNTVVVQEREKQIPVDTGFMVFNPLNYPNLIRLFHELDVPIKKTEMSFSVQHCPTGLEYAGTGLNGLFAQRKNIFSPRHISMLMQINRFNKLCVYDMQFDEYRNLTVAGYVRKREFGEDMLFKYLLPMTSALWSTPTDTTMQFPILALVRFFDNHGFLGLNTQHQWYTVAGGSKEYRDRLIAPFAHRIRKNESVLRVERSHGKVILTSTHGRLEYDKVIFACHADQALEAFGNPYDQEIRLLSKFSYQKNTATLHSDTSVMPQNRKTWSSWNYRIEEVDGKLQPSCIYYMNALQGVSDQEHYFVSINGDPKKIDASKIHSVLEYEHPIFTRDAMAAQKHLPDLNDNGPVYFCGSYFRYGFHEDAFTSAIDLCKKILGKGHEKVSKYTSPLHGEKTAALW